MVLNFTLHSLGHYQVTAQFHHQGVWAISRAGRMFKTMDAALAHTRVLRSKGRGCVKDVKVTNLNTGKVWQIVRA